MGERLDGSRQPPKDIYLYIARLARIDLTSLSVTFAECQCLYHFTIYALL